MLCQAQNKGLMFKSVDKKEHRVTKSNKALIKINRK